MGEHHLTNDRGMLIRDNVYGTLQDDAWRRDFTINSLYYSVETAAIVDYTHGFSDIQQRLIRIIGDPVTRYQEDPVRMLRAIRFSAKLNFDLSPETAAPMTRLSTLIRHISGSRLFDEMTKLYQCGSAKSAHQLLVQYGLFAQLFEQTHQLTDSHYPVNALLSIALENTDTRIRENKPVTPAFLFAVLLWFPLLQKTEEIKKSGLPPLPALEKAMSQLIAEQNKIVTIPKRFSLMMREIWILQYRLPRRVGNRPFALLSHPRFRAAYDFLAIRALAGDESIALAEWWTTFQEVDLETQQKMIAELSAPRPKKKRQRKKPASS